MQHDAMTALLVLGHLMMGGLFVQGGIVHFMTLQSVTKEVADSGMPFPKVVLVFGSAAQILFGVLLILGIAVTLSALVLFAFTVAASLIMLRFWTMQGSKRDAAKNNFESNVAILGGLLVIAVQAWP